MPPAPDARHAETTNQPPRLVTGCAAPSVWRLRIRTTFPAEG